MNKLRSLYHNVNSFRKKYWNDPVWSKVIAAGIIFLLGTILSTLFILLKTIYSQIPISQSATQLLNFLSNSTKINNTIILVFSFILISYIIVSIRRIQSEIIIKKKAKSQKEKIGNAKDKQPIATMHSSVFFSYRLSEAFPGQRGLQWYEPKLAAKRLKIALKYPIFFDYTKDDYDSTSDPIWWFRGSDGLHIEECKILSKTKILLGRDEIQIKRMAVNIDRNYKNNFIYLEAKGEKQTGLYNFTSEEIKNSIERIGYCYEEYGLLGKKAISRAEYDDGNTVIRGEVVNASDAELRVRYLSDYNIIICAKNSPYNSNAFGKTEKLFNGIITGKTPVDDLFSFLSVLCKQM